MSLVNEIRNGNIKKIRKVLKLNDTILYDLLDTMGRQSCNNVNKYIIKKLKIDDKRFCRQLGYYSFLDYNYDMFKYISKKNIYPHYDINEFTRDHNLYVHLCKLGRKLYIQKYCHSALYMPFNATKFIFMLQTLI